MALNLRKNKGLPLTFDEIDGNFEYLESIIGGGATGPQGPEGVAGATGPQGLQGPSGATNVSLDWAAIANQTQQGPFQVISDTYRTLPFDGQGANRQSFGGSSDIGLTAANGFGCKISIGGSGIGRAYKIMAASDVEAGNNKVVGMRLRVYERNDEFSSWSFTDVLPSECHASTGFSSGFAKTFTEWIWVPSRNEEEVVVTLANLTDSGFNDLYVNRIKMIVTDLGPVNL